MSEKNEEVEKEINDLLGGLGDDTPAEKKEEQEEVVEGEEKEESGEDLEESTVVLNEGETHESDEEDLEDDKDEVVEDKDKKTEKEEEGEEPEKKEDDDELTILKNQNASLMTKINELSGPKKAEEETQKPVLPKTVAETFKDLDPQDIMSSKEKFTEFLTNLSEVIQINSTQKTLQSIPDVVGNFLTRKASTDEIKEKFYSDNPELAEVKDYVASVANVVASENPEMKIQDMLKETNVRVRKALNLTKEVKKKEEVRDRKKPAFGKNKSSNRKSKPKKDELESDLNAMLPEG